MKKILACALVCMILCFTIVGCANGDISNTTTPDETTMSHTESTTPTTESTVQTNPKTEEPEEDENEFPFKVKVAYANWSDDYRIYEDALNANAIDGFMHLPIYRLDTLEDVESFKTTFEDCFSFDSSYDEVVSFSDAIESCDEAFFNENSLMLVYVTASSGSDRYDVATVGYDETLFNVQVYQIDNKDSGTCDMAGWFMIVETPDDIVNGCEEFDAEFIMVEDLF